MPIKSLKTDSKEMNEERDRRDPQVHTSPSGSVNPSEAILMRLRLAANAANDAQLADFLGINRQGILKARKKGSVPTSWLVTASEKSGFSLNWLYYGLGGKSIHILTSSKLNAKEIVDAISDALDFREGVLTVKARDQYEVYFLIMALAVSITGIHELHVEQKESYSYLVLDLSDRDVYIFIDYKFNIDVDADYTILRVIRNYSECLDCKYYSSKHENNNIIEDLRTMAEHQDVFDMHVKVNSAYGNLFDRQDLVINKSIFQLIEQNEKKGLRADIERIVELLKESGANDEVIQNAIIKIIEKH